MSVIISGRAQVRLKSEFWIPFYADRDSVMPDGMHPDDTVEILRADGRLAGDREPLPASFWTWHFCGEASTIVGYRYVGESEHKNVPPPDAIDVFLKAKP